MSNYIFFYHSNRSLCSCCNMCNFNDLTNDDDYSVVALYNKHRKQSLVIHICKKCMNEKVYCHGLETKFKLWTRDCKKVYQLIGIL